MTPAYGLPDLRGREPALRAAIMAELGRSLRIDPASVDCGRPFDDYGLDSIEAVIVLGGVSERLGVDLPPELLFLYPTADSVIGALTKEGQASIRPFSHGLLEAFWFPGGGIMDEPQAIDFRAALARDLTFKVIRVGGWREWRHHELGMADIVSGALAQIEVAVPKGPLLLIGFCQGGQLAYATALAAVEAGREVQRVILIDAVLAETAATLGERILYLVRELTGRPGDDRDRVERGAQIPFAAWEVIQRLVPQGVLLGAMARFSESLLKRPNGVRMARRVQMQLFYTLWKAWLQRRRETLRVPVTLLRADGPGADDLGWGPLCPELLVVRVGGDHRSIFAPENHESLRIALLDGLADRKRNQALEKVEA